MKTIGAKLTTNTKQRPILFLKPLFKKTVWGGNRLRSDFGYELPEDHIGECWTTSARDDEDSLIRDGFYEGKTLSQMWEEHRELFGNLPMNHFPLLSKIIDAKEDLSIQVHPDDEYAHTHENGSSGKKECWYILDCPKDAKLIIGHNAATNEELHEMIHEGRWAELLHEEPIKKGDFIQINPGTLHAIKKGTMIFETQQNCDITYRVYDYDRLKDGKPRELHLQKSMDVISVPSLVDNSIQSFAFTPDNTMQEMISCSHYLVWKLKITTELHFMQNYPFLNVCVIDGEGLVNGQPVKKGDSFILPSEFGEVSLQGNMEMIASSISK